MVDHEDQTADIKPVPLDQLEPIDQIDQRYAISLLVFHRNGARVVPLSPGKSVTIGRVPPVDVLIQDNTLSRHHARFELMDESVVVEDLKSTNGVWMDGKRIEQGVLQPGNEVRLGRIVVSVHLLGSSEGPMHRLISHDQFRGVLEEEISRAKPFGAKLTMLHVQAPDPGETVSRWLPMLRKLLRPADHIALYSNNAVEIFLPKLDSTEAKELVKKMLRRVKKAEKVAPRLRIGISTYPDSSATAEGLIHASRKAALQSTDQKRVRVADPQAVRSWREDGPPGRSFVSLTPVVGSQAMKDVYAAVDRLAKTDIPVLLFGETGTGKEVVARAIHDRSNRRKNCLCCINCAAIPEQLVESTLFGHVRGAFTGASKDAVGVFEEADGGSVLLDEIADLPLLTQAKLLRAIETKQVSRVGSPKEKAVDVRIIAATHRNVEEMCEAGQFRWDLFYRINTMTLEIPPLRDRQEEIPLLADQFIRQANQVHDSGVRSIGEEALRLLASYYWPGNVRELRNAIERAVVLAQGEEITVEDLPERVQFHKAEGNRDRRPRKTDAHASVLDAKVDLRPDEKESDDEPSVDFKARVQEFESRLILEALEQTRGNKTATAQMLRIPLRTLVRKIKAYSLSLPKDTDR